MSGAQTPERRVSVAHHCDGIGDHEAPVEVYEVLEVTLGTRYRGFRCDGSRIEWVVPRTSRGGR